MAMKKIDTAPEAVGNDLTGTEPEPVSMETPELSKAEPAGTMPDKTANETPAESSGGICVYLGPSIHGVIQSGTVYGGTKGEVKEQLAAVIKEYPLIARLIVTGETLAGDRIKVKTPGSLLNNAYKKLASGQKTV